jgi:predicted aldo/keto reductase-like oxidoreductase
MKKESLLLKFIDLWSLSKVVLSASVLFFYTIKTYFFSKYRYNALIELIEAHAEGKVVMIMSPDEFLELMKGASEEVENLDKDLE